MLNVDEARRARETLGSVLASIDRGDLEATKAQRAHIAGAVTALNELKIGQKVKHPPRQTRTPKPHRPYRNGTFPI